MACRLIVLILLTAPFIYCQKLITILSDFNNDKDLEFFKTTLPWIVDNIGSNIDLKFHFNDSGIKSGPRQCVLLQLSRNIYLQVDYLSCEANGNLHSECIKHLPIDIPRLHRCLRSSVKRIVRNAEREFQRFKASVTPVVILPRRRIINDNTPQNILNSICDLYPRQYMRPVGCIKPSPLLNKNQENDKTNETSTPQSETTPNEKNQEEEPTTESEEKLKEEKSETENEAKPKEEESDPKSEEKENKERGKPENEPKPKVENQQD